MPVNTITNLQNTQAPQASSTGALGKDDFLKLMISQLRYQDPMSPMDGSQFASQLAQFSSLEQLSNLNTNMESSINANYYLTQSINNTLSATLIGKDVKLSGGEIPNTGQESIKLGYNLPKEAMSAEINIYDSNGNLVKTIKNIENSSGDHKLSWDFTDNNGTKLPKGSYKFEVKAKDLNKADMSATLFKYGTIDGIRFSETGSRLIVDGAEYQLSDILEIVNPQTTGGTK